MKLFNLYLKLFLIFFFFSLVSLSAQNIKPPSSNYTDEFGSGSGNSVLGGLGGPGQYVSVPPNGQWSQYVDGSVEAWVFPTNLSHNNTIMSKGVTSSALCFSFGISSTGSLYFKIGTTTYQYSSIPISTNTWTHVAAAWYGGPNTYILNFFVNGQNVLTFGPVPAIMDISNDSLIIGGSQAVPSEYFEGFLDETRFWTSQLSGTKVAENRFVGLGDATGANINSNITSGSYYRGLVSSWTFNTNGTAYDDISGFNGTYVGGAHPVPAFGGRPMPYNLVLKFPNTGAFDFVSIPPSPVFNLTLNGTFECWVNLNINNIFQPVFQKGASSATTSISVYITPDNKLGFNIGSHFFISTGPALLTPNKWYHIAVTWSGGPNFTVKLYVNGQLDDTQTFNTSMPVNSDSAWVGRSFDSNRFNGFVDELRLWGATLSNANVKAVMNVSGRALASNPNLLACYNFDGNLNNISSTSGINGTFATGTSTTYNNCRFSGYSNEITTGPVSSNFKAHSTVINGTNLATAFFKSTLNKSIPSGSTISDTIQIGFSALLNSAQVFMQIEDSLTSSLQLSLTSPNGTTVVLSDHNGGTSKNGYLTIFDDAAVNAVTSSTFLSPWSNYVQPQNTMGNFGSANVSGAWVLNITKDNSTGAGTLISWGVRFNNLVTVISGNSNNVPDVFRLYQNYPNPFNPASKIRFDVPKTQGAGGSVQNVKLVIYDMLGKEVMTLVNESLLPGTYEVNFNGANISSGSYFYVLQGMNFRDTKKMILIK